MEKPMNPTKIPQTDSIEELAQFWDTHDLTDFDDQLEEVKDKVFERETLILIRLQTQEVTAVEAMAKSQVIDYHDLIREWGFKKVARV
jgi:predicted DNA binding CopG/RHH family protein